MPKIKFKGKEYDRLIDMPAKVRHDYFKARAGYDVSEEESLDKANTMAGIVQNMSDDVREIYERARHQVEARPVTRRPVDELPRAADLYRNSAPDEMQNQPSDEVIYKPSPPIIEPPSPIIESDHTLRKLAIWLVIGALLAGIFVAIYFGGL